MIILLRFLLMSLPAKTGAAQAYTISDFGKTPSEAPGWVWESFSDGVMGGKSELAAPRLVEAEGRKALLLAGKVVTKGGGFIQVRLRHDPSLFDAGSFAGVELEVDDATSKSW